MKSTIGLLSLLLLTLALLGACGGEQAANCDPTCTGCCTEQGACIESTWDGQCGIGGALCQDCALTNSTCNESGECTCSGCMRTDGTCASGKWNDECGAGGETCMECIAPQACADGDCVSPPECRPGECDGCCQGNDCLTGIANSACGKDGQE